MQTAKVCKNLCMSQPILDEIERCVRGQSQFELLLLDAIKRARANNVSWDDIAGRMGISRQLCIYRYKRFLTEEKSA